MRLFGCGYCSGLSETKVLRLMKYMDQEVSFPQNNFFGSPRVNQHT